MNLPNALTLLRVALIPVFFFLFMVDTSWGNILGALIFAFASFTDFLDGYLARRDNLVTNFGKIMDPLADKLLVMTALLCLIALDRVGVWVVALILGRELAITGIRTVAAAEGIVVAASPLGKAKTVTQMLAIILLLLNISPGIYLLYLALVLTLVSGADYIYKLSSRIDWL